MNYKDFLLMTIGAAFVSLAISTPIYFGLGFLNLGIGYLSILAIIFGALMVAEINAVRKVVKNA